ncbi:MAG: type II toxin-antitoxin system RelE/ParE family toxin [Mucilaginibacter sp.]
MTYTVKFYPKAEVEYLEAFNWYEERLQGLGERFEHCIEKKINAIVKNPLFYPNKKYDCRECKVVDFPYLIIYKIFPNEGVILIVSIFHTSRKPNRKYR